MSTFYNALQNTDDCVILIQDENDAVFGAYTEEAWQMGKLKFYGNGQTFVFKFNYKNQVLSQFAALQVKDDQI